MGRHRKHRLTKLKTRKMDKMKMMKEMSGLVGGHRKNSGGHGGYGGHGGHGQYGGQMNDKKAMKEAMKLAKTKDMKQIDPAVLDYAATRLQAGFRGYQTRKNMKNH